MAMKQRVNTGQRAFTIVELLIVVVVIAILASITIVAYNGISTKSKQSALQSELSQASKALDAKKNMSTSGLYPPSLADIGVNDDKLTYNYNSRSNTYCIDGRDGDIRYSVRGSTLKVVEGSCIDQGMAVWLPFNGNANDASGNEFATSTNGTPSVVNGADGRLNGAYALDGNNQFFTIQGADSIPARLDRFTVSIWAKGTGAGGNDYGYMAHKGSTTSIGNSVFYIGTNAGVAQNITASVNGQFGSGSTGVGSNANDWRHIVLVYAGGYQTGYIDGVQRNDTSVGALTVGTTGTTMTIGAGVAGYRDFVGSVDDFRVYNRALTGNEVGELYNDGAQ